MWDAYVNYLCTVCESFSWSPPHKVSNNMKIRHPGSQEEKWKYEKFTKIEVAISSYISDIIIQGVEHARLWYTTWPVAQQTQVMATLSKCWVWISQVQHFHNVAVTLMKRINHNIVATLPQHWYNIVTILKNYIILQRCHNITATLKILDHNIDTTFRQCWEIKLFSTLSQLCYHIAGMHQNQKLDFPFSKKI